MRRRPSFTYTKLAGKPQTCPSNVTGFIDYQGLGGILGGRSAVQSSSDRRRKKATSMVCWPMLSLCDEIEVKHQRKLEALGLIRLVEPSPATITSHQETVKRTTSSASAITTIARIAGMPNAPI